MSYLSRSFCGVPQCFQLSDTFLLRYTVFSRVICALFFPILAAEKSGCVKYADFFLWRPYLGFILV